MSPGNLLARCFEECQRREHHHGGGFTKLAGLQGGEKESAKKQKKNQQNTADSTNFLGFSFFFSNKNNTKKISSDGPTSSLHQAASPCFVAVQRKEKSECHRFAQGAALSELQVLGKELCIRRGWF